jgi:AraC family transcriptional activator of pobA
VYAGEDMDKIPFYALYGDNHPINELDFLHMEPDPEAGRHGPVEGDIHPHRHENLHQFIYLERGRILPNLDAIKSVCDAPCVISIPPMAVHSVHIEPGSRRYLLTVSGSFISRTLAESEIPHIERILARSAAIRLRRDCYPGDQIHGLMTLIHKEFLGHLEARVSLISALLKALLIQLGRLAYAEGDYRWGNPQQSSIYRRFRTAVEEHYRDHWEVQRYAELLGVTKGRLNAICQQTTGCAPSQIIHNRLLLEAKRNLVYTNKTINMIAYELGFADPNYFSRFFRRYSGETATAFKAQSQQTP